MQRALGQGELIAGQYRHKKECHTAKPQLSTTALTFTLGEVGGREFILLYSKHFSGSQRLTVQSLQQSRLKISRKKCSTAFF